jgi:leukotriene-A4 hydrolase
MDDAYKLTACENSEVKFRWQSLCLLAHAADPEAASWIVPHVVAFLGAQGRMKFVRPLYRALKGLSDKSIALDAFGRLKNTYHPIARKMVAADLGVTL